MVVAGSRAVKTRRTGLRWGLAALALCTLAAVALVIFAPSGLALDGLPEQQEAKRTGEPVEIKGNRTTTSTTWANPDGTFRKDMSSVAIRAKVGKKWKRFDLTLERHSDGSIGPKASPNREVLSGGGTEPLLALTFDGVRVSTRWPTKLPRPSIEGPAATYAEVLPGVDLRMTVTDAGTTQVLIVKNRAAAENHDLGELRLKTTAKNGAVQASATGGLSVVDTHGREVARLRSRPCGIRGGSCAMRVRKLYVTRRK